MAPPDRRGDSRRGADRSASTSPSRHSSRSTSSRSSGTSPEAPAARWRARADPAPAGIDRARARQRAAPVERLSAARRRRSRVQRASRASGAPLTCATAPPGRRRRRSSSACAADRSGRSSNRAARRAASSTSAPRSRPARSRAISVGSPDALPSLVQDAPWCTRTAERGEFELGRRAVQIRSTRIRFSVSVPVLSVQITVVAPSVSTALSRLTRAPPRASRRTPSASASVIVGSSPSGTLATSRPIANISASWKGSPANMPMGRTRCPATTAIRAISHATRRTCRWSGLSSWRVRCDSAAIRPSSVRHPGREHDRRARRRRCTWCR